MPDAFTSRMRRIASGLELPGRHERTKAIVDAGGLEFAVLLGNPKPTDEISLTESEIGILSRANKSEPLSQQHVRAIWDVKCAFPGSRIVEARKIR